MIHSEESATAIDLAGPNVPGLLVRVTGLFAARGLNVQKAAAGAMATPAVRAEAEGSSVSTLERLRLLAVEDGDEGPQRDDKVHRGQ